MRSKSFNIVIRPPLDISNKALAVGKKLKNKGGLFILDGKSYFPHITIYMAEFPVKNFSKNKKILSEFADETKPFRATPLQYR